MKMYILAFATLLSAAGSASANNDYIECRTNGNKAYSDSYMSQHCGSRDRNGDSFKDGKGLFGRGNNYSKK